MLDVAQSMRAQILIRKKFVSPESHKSIWRGDSISQINCVNLGTNLETHFPKTTIGHQSILMRISRNI
jgi:NADPH-dependent curcumin reductase CurA